jgi:hypothetical protein
MNPAYLQQLEEIFYRQQKQEMGLNDTELLEEELRITQRERYEDELNGKPGKLRSGKREGSAILPPISEEGSTNEDELGDDLIEIVEQSRKQEVEQMVSLTK